MAILRVAVVEESAGAGEVTRRVGDALSSDG